MPYTLPQHKLFEFVAHNPAKARAEGIKVKPTDAAKMASEGIKPGEKKKKKSAAQTVYPDHPQRAQHG